MSRPDVDGSALPLHRRLRGQQIEDEFRASPVSGPPTARIRLAPPAPPPPPPAPPSPIAAAVASARSRDSVLRFRRAAVAMALEADPATRSQAEARECAAALSDLAVAAHETQLAALLRADPSAADATWTVACYQIGDLSPSALRDFAEAAPAVRTLFACETAAHVAAELIVTNGDSVRWTALVRSGTDVVYQPLTPVSATAPTDGGLREVRNRWEDQLLLWAADPTRDLDPPADEPVRQPDGAGPQPAVADGSPIGAVLGEVLGEVLEAVRHIEARLPAAGAELPAPAPRPGDTGASGSSLELLAGRLEAVEAELAHADRRAENLESQLRQVEGRLAASEARLAGAGAGGLDRMARRPGLVVLLARWVAARLTEWADGAVHRGGTAEDRSRARRIELVPADEWPSG